MRYLLTMTELKIEPLMMLSAVTRGAHVCTLDMEAYRSLHSSHKTRQSNRYQLKHADPKSIIMEARPR